MNPSPIKEAQSSPISRLTIFVLLILFSVSGWASLETPYGALVVGSWTDNEMGPGDEDIPQNNEKPSDKKDPWQKQLDELEDSLAKEASGCWKINKTIIEPVESSPFSKPSDSVLKLRENILLASKLCAVDNGRPKSEDERKSQPSFSRERMTFSLMDSADNTVGGPWGMSINRKGVPKCPCYSLSGQEAEAMWWQAFPAAGRIHPEVRLLVKSACNWASSELTKITLELGERLDVRAKGDHK